MASPAKPDRLLIASAGSIVLAVVIVAVQLPAVLAAVFGSGMGKDEPREVLAKLMDEHDKEMSTYQARFNGRSLFFKPPAPALRPRPAPPPPQEDPPPPPPPPPASTVYTGPSVVAILGDEVWFRAPRAGETGLRIRVGDQREGITVLAVNAPWSVQLGYERGEYDVDLFARTLPDLFNSPPPVERVPGLHTAPSTEEAIEQGGTVGAETGVPAAPADTADDTGTEQAPEAEGHPDDEGEPAPQAQPDGEAEPERNADAARDEDEDIEAQEEPDREAEPDAESGAEPGSDDQERGDDDASETNDASNTEEESSDESPDESPGQ